MLVGLPHLEALTSGQVFSLKMVFNARGAIFLPVKEQHRHHKVEGISYEDDYKGDAMAAMLAPGSIEIRYHQKFRDADVARIMRALLSRPELASIATSRVTYQGRVLSLD